MIESDFGKYFAIKRVIIYLLSYDFQGTLNKVLVDLELAFKMKK